MSFWKEVDENLEKGKTEKVVKVTTKELADFRQQITDLENEMIHSQNRIQSLTEIRIDLTKQVEDLKSHSDMIDQLHQEIENQLEVIAQLKEKGAKKDRLIKEFKQKLDEAIGKIKTLVEENDQKSHQLANLAKRENDQKTQLETLSTQMAKITAEKDANLHKLKDYDVMIVEIQELKRAAKRKDIEVQEVTSKIESMEKKLKESLEQVTSASEADLKAKDTKITQLEKELKETALRIKEEQAEYQTLKSSLQDELDVEKARFTEELDSKNLLIQELRDQLSHYLESDSDSDPALESALDTVRGETSSSASSSEENTPESSSPRPSRELNSQIAALGQKLRISNTKVLELQQQVRDLSKSASKTQLQSSTNEMELENYRTNYVPKADYDEILAKLQGIQEKYSAVAKNREIILNENESLRVQLEQFTSREQDVDDHSSSTSRLDNINQSARSEKVITPGIVSERLQMFEDKAIMTATEKEAQDSLFETHSSEKSIDGGSSETDLQNDSEKSDHLAEEDSENSFSSNELHTSRLKCPRCGSIKIHQVDDRDKIISYIPTVVYAKKNICSQCGLNF